MDHTEIKNLYQMITAAEKEIKEYFVCNKNLNKVILLGNTGAGKTTVSCILAGKKITVKPFKRKSAILDFEGIKPGGKSITRIPTIMVNNENDLLLGDCPGFEDTEGTKQEIVNAFAIDFFLTMFNEDDNKIKILLVMKANEIGAARSKLITQNFERMEAMFPNKKELKKGVGIIFTQTDPKKDGIDYIDELNEDAPEIVQKWCNYFMDHEDQIFVIPEVSRDEINKEYIYEDREKLIDFLKKEQIINPIHSISLSQNAKDDLEKMLFKRRNQLNEIITQVFDLIYQLCCKETSSVALYKLSEKLQRMSKIDIHNSSDLKNAIIQNFSNNEEFSFQIEELTEYEAFDSFINKVFNIRTSKLQKAYQKKILSTINQLDIILRHVRTIEQGKSQIDDLQIVLSKQEQITSDLKSRLAEQKATLEKNKVEMQQKMQAQESDMKKKIQCQKMEMQRKIQTQERQMNEMKSKLSLIENNDMVVKSRPKKIKSSLPWQQISAACRFNQSDLIGILRHLSIESRCNIHEDGTIQITSNSIKNTYLTPKNLVDFNYRNYYLTDDISDSFICFDFIDQKIQIQSYLIASPIFRCNESFYLKNWVIEASNDNKKWETLDIQNNCEALNGQYKCIFNVSKSNNEYYRYIRLKQTGYSWTNKNYIAGICFIDFYGRLLQPKFK